GDHSSGPGVHVCEPRATPSTAVARGCGPAARYLASLERGTGHRLEAASPRCGRLGLAAFGTGSHEHGQAKSARGFGERTPQDVALAPAGARRPQRPRQTNDLGNWPISTATTTPLRSRLGLVSRVCRSYRDGMRGP